MRRVLIQIMNWMSRLFPEEVSTVEQSLSRDPVRYFECQCSPGSYCTNQVNHSTPHQHF